MTLAIMVVMDSSYNFMLWAMSDTTTPGTHLNHVMPAGTVQLLLLGQQVLHPLDLVSSGLLLIRPALPVSPMHLMHLPQSPETHLVPTRIEVWIRWGPTWWTTE